MEDGIIFITNFTIIIIIIIIAVVTNIINIIIINEVLHYTKRVWS